MLSALETKVTSSFNCPSSTWTVTSKPKVEETKEELPPKKVEETEESLEESLMNTTLDEDEESSYSESMGESINKLFSDIGDK